LFVREREKRERERERKRERENKGRAFRVCVCVCVCPSGSACGAIGERARKRGLRKVIGKQYKDETGPAACVCVHV
jgi:hypothetical protein